MRCSGRCPRRAFSDSPPTKSHRRELVSHGNLVPPLGEGSRLAEYSAFLADAAG